MMVRPIDIVRMGNKLTQFTVAWANNGDQISKLYAGTSALKGDFTRTGKRDLHGMVSRAASLCNSS